MITSLENNKDKFKIIKKLSQSITDAKRERNDIVNKDVKKIYDIVFKNLASKKTKTELINKNRYGDDVYFVCNTGISKKGNNSYSINAENINRIDDYSSNNNQFAEQLIVVGTNQTLFLKVLSKQKKDVFKKFMKDVELLKKNKNSSIVFNEDNEILINEYIGIKDNDDFEIKQKKVKELSILRENVEIEIICQGTNIKKSYVGNFEQQSFGDTQIATNRQGLSDFILIEQLYTPLKRLLETELKLRLKELENTKKYFSYLNDTFSSYLMFNELNTTNKTNTTN